MATRPGALRGFMLATLVGDAIGLPFEGVPRQRVAALLGDRRLTHRLIGPFGMVSDDTEHMALTAAAWRRAGGDADRFTALLGWALRRWALCVPPATGMATARSCAKLLVGFPPTKSGVNSAGNGPLMRAGVLGVLCDNEESLLAHVRIASRITHTDPRAEHAALAIALAARVSADPTVDEPLDAYGGVAERLVPQGEVRDALAGVFASVRAGEPTDAYLASIGCERGVSGFAMHTAPCIVHVWLSAPSDVAGGIEACVRFGGDTDSVASILGGILGARSGAGDIPEPWLRGVRDFPMSVGYVERLARWIEGEGPRPHRARFVFAPLRNLVLFVIAVYHGVRRFFPPYS